MLNLGMTEVLLFAIIALIVLGPDKLPEAARFAGRWYGKIKRMISSVQQDIDRELRMSELREQMQQELEKIKQLEEKMQLQLHHLEHHQFTEQFNEQHNAKASSLKNQRYHACSTTVAKAPFVSPQLTSMHAIELKKAV